MTGILASPDILNLRPADCSVKGTGNAHTETGCAKLETWDLDPHGPIKAALGQAIPPKDGTEELNTVPSSQEMYLGIRRVLLCTLTLLTYFQVLGDDKALSAGFQSHAALCY